MITKDDPRFEELPGEWIKPYIDFANGMIDIVATAMAAGTLVPAETMEGWRKHLFKLIDMDDTDLVDMLQKAQHPENFVYIAGRIVGRESAKRRKKLI